MSSGSKNNNLHIFATKTPWQFIFVVILYTIGAVSFPTSIFSYILGSSENAKMISIFLSRAICLILPIWLIFEVKTQKILLGKFSLKSLVIILPFLIVVINNFPIISLLSGDVSFSDDNNFIKWLCYSLVVLGGVLIEEFTFRGLVLPTLYMHFKSSNKRVFLTVLAQSALFGLVHLVNLFAGSGFVPVIMQIGYSFLIGAVCGIAFIKTGNFYSAVVIHFIFNLGGMLYDYNMISGNVWTNLTIVVTVIIAIIVAIYALYLVFIDKNDKLKEVLYLSEEE